MTWAMAVTTPDRDHRIVIASTSEHLDVSVLADACLGTRLPLREHYAIFSHLLRQARWISVSVKRRCRLLPDCQCQCQCHAAVIVTAPARSEYCRSATARPQSHSFPPTLHSSSLHARFGLLSYQKSSSQEPAGSGFQLLSSRPRSTAVMHS